MISATRWERVSNAGAARDVFERRGGFGNGCRSDDLVLRTRTEQRLESHQVASDLRPVIRRGAERIRPVSDASRMSSTGALSSTTASPAVAADERLDLVKVPHRLKPTRGLGLAGPAGIVGVNDAVPRRFGSAKTVAFPLPDMPVTCTMDRIEAR